MKKQNNNKKYGLQKERELRKYFETLPDVFFAKRSRGSFGAFDIEVYTEESMILVSVKSTRQDNISYKSEIEKLKQIKVPKYCKKFLYIWWSPNANREKRGWEKIEIE